MENAEESLSPARHLTTHATISSSISRYRTVPLALSARQAFVTFPFPSEAARPSAPQSSRARWRGLAWISPLRFFHAAAQRKASKMLRGIKTACSITQDALGKGKTAPAPPLAAEGSPHHLYPRRKARVKHGFSTPQLAKQGLTPTLHLLKLTRDASHTGGSAS